MNFLRPISFLWLGPISAAVVTAVAVSVSRFDGAGATKDQSGLVAFEK